MPKGLHPKSAIHKANQIKLKNYHQQVQEERKEMLQESQQAKQDKQDLSLRLAELESKLENKLCVM